MLYYINCYNIIYTAPICIRSYSKIGVRLSVVRRLVYNLHVYVHDRSPFLISSLQSYIPGIFGFLVLQFGCAYIYQLQKVTSCLYIPGHMVAYACIIYILYVLYIYSICMHIYVYKKYTSHVTVNNTFVAIYETDHYLLAGI